MVARVFPRVAKWGCSLNYGCSYVSLLAIQAQGQHRREQFVSRVNSDCEALVLPFPKDPTEGDNKHARASPAKTADHTRAERVFFLLRCLLF